MDSCGWDDNTKFVCFFEHPGDMGKVGIDGGLNRFALDHRHIPFGQLCVFGDGIPVEAELARYRALAQPVLEHFMDHFYFTFFKHEPPSEKQEEDSIRT